MPPKRKRYDYTVEALHAAVQDVQEGKLSKRMAAKTYGVPSSTIHDRLSGRRPFGQINRRVLTTEEEDIVVKWLQESASRGLRRSKDQILDTVQAMLKGKEEKMPFKNNRPGRTWYKNFFRRHKELSFHLPPAVSEACKIKRAIFKDTKLQNWYKKIYGEISAADSNLFGDPGRLFTCDNLSFNLGGSTSKMWAPRTYKEKVKTTNVVNDRVTVLACGSASGEFLSPLLIFPGETFNFKPLIGFPGAHFSRSAKVWITESIMRNWLKAAFIPAVKSIKKPIILFIDREKHFLCLSLSELCNEHQIILIQLPYYSCHIRPIVHPLDLASFGDLKQAWREEVLLYQDEKADILERKDFSKVFKKAWERAVENNPLVKGFKNAGIFPWDPDIVDVTQPRKPIGLKTTTENDTQMTESIERTEDVDSESSEETAMEDCPDITSVEPQKVDSFISSSDDSDTNDTSSSHQPCSPHPIDPSPSSPVVQQTNYPSDLPMACPLELPPMIMLDRLLELSAKAGIDKLIQYRTISDLDWKRHNPDPEEQYFIHLYRKLKGILSEFEKKHLRRETTYDVICHSSSPQISPKKRKLFMEPEETVHSESVSNRLSCAE